MMDGENFRKNLRIQTNDDPNLKGLELFRRSLERDYFAKVSVRNCNCNKVENTNVVESSNLVVDLECNFNLIEVLYYLEKGSWGQSSSSNQDSGTLKTAFYESLLTFQNINDIEIDVEELSIILKDTIIVIKRIFSQSIGQQLGHILHALAAHYVHFTRDLTETPYEIYLPVYTEEVPSNDSLICNVRRDTNSARDYFSYWALYFDSSPEGKIYDLEGKCIISGDLHMLNH